MGSPPLHCCTTPGAVDLLLSYQADLEKRQSLWGMSALGAAAMKDGNAEVVSRLIHRRAPVDELPKGLGQGPLHWACDISDDTDIVRALLASRADPDSAARPQGPLRLMSRALATYHG